MSNLDNAILNSIERVRTMWLQVVGVIEMYAIPESREGVARMETVIKTVDKALSFADELWQKQIYETLLSRTIGACAKLEEMGITPDEMAHTLIELVETVCKVTRVVMPQYESYLSAEDFAKMYVELFLHEGKQELLNIRIELASMFNLATLCYQVYSEKGE